MAETLFLRGVDPARPVGSVAELDALVETGHRLLDANKDRPGRMTTGDATPGRETWVYGRAGRPCRRCGTPIRKGQGGLRGRNGSASGALTASGNPTEPPAPARGAAEFAPVLKPDGRLCSDTAAMAAAAVTAAAVTAATGAAAAVAVYVRPGGPAVLALALAAGPLLLAHHRYQYPHAAADDDQATEDNRDDDPDIHVRTPCLPRESGTIIVTGKKVKIHAAKEIFRPA